MLPQVIPAALATVVALIVFYLPILGVYTMMWAAMIFEDARRDYVAFLAFIHAIPALVAIVSSLALALLFARRVTLAAFAASVVIPASVLSIHSAVIGRYEASEAAVYLFFTVATIGLFTVSTRRYSNAKALQAAGQASCEGRLSGKAEALRQLS